MPKWPPVQVEEPVGLPNREGRTCCLWTVDKTVDAGVPAPLPLTPAHDAQLEQVARNVGTEDLYHQSVEVVALKAHPGEAGKQGEVQEDGAGATGGLRARQCHRLTEQEAHVQQEDSQQQVHVHFDGVVT